MSRQNASNKFDVAAGMRQGGVVALKERRPQPILNTTSFVRWTAIPLPCRVVLPTPCFLFRVMALQMLQGMAAHRTPPRRTYDTPSRNCPASSPALSRMPFCPWTLHIRVLRREGVCTLQRCMMRTTMIFNAGS